MSASVGEPSGPRWWGAVRECVVVARCCGRENETWVLTCLLFDFGTIGVIGALVEGVVAGTLGWRVVAGGLSVGDLVGSDVGCSFWRHSLHSPPPFFQHTSSDVAGCRMDKVLESALIQPRR